MTEPTPKVDFEIGQLVRVVESTHQDGLPFNRVGVVTAIGTDKSGRTTGVYEVLFASKAGTVQMKFWHKFLERVVK
jgi:hypothetical protein